ncbi:hypothetical protein KD050_20740 [Psychrobacillus sp. INOP01]|uniref:hypothetical protein n=1 Tax=Psychrobacillus sp. INOP01 TaxID=2829187 RepID=UPI001BAB059D|nr:hypothetical protein [Psychrobacillus sp. INOP01]QUG41657.1 hypothetical protein KD050_20740 [Psychrobacillus sp. INOP01]
MKKAITIGLILVSILLSGCNTNKLSNAEFNNTTPGVIKIDNLTYRMTDEVLATNEVEKQIGKITQIQELVSYSEDQNPYKSPSKIFKIKDINIEEAIAINVNDNIFFANRTYSASDVLGDYADLNAENPFVSMASIDFETEDIFTSIDIPEETQRELIDAFKNAKFERVTDISSDYDYRIKITFNTGYAMYVDSDKKLLVIVDTNESYTIENDSDFFKILKNFTKIK